MIIIYLNRKKTRSIAFALILRLKKHSRYISNFKTKQRIWHRTYVSGCKRR